MYTITFEIAARKGDHLHICTFSHLHINQAFAHLLVCHFHLKASFTHQVGNVVKLFVSSFT